LAQAAMADYGLLEGTMNETLHVGTFAFKCLAVLQ